MLELKKVWFAYPGYRDFVLKDTSISVSNGEIVCVMGDNGSGKTTLLNIMAGLLEPVKGEVFFMGKPLSKQLPGARRHIGLLFQNPEYMLFNPRVSDEISYTLRQLHDDEIIIKEKMLWALDRVGLEHDILDRHTFSLSYGEKKLVALAAILAYEPTLLLLDEPFTSLSKEKKLLLKKIVLEHKDNGGSVVYTMHDRDEACSCDSVFLLDNHALRRLL